jgi:hypothetical protein
LLDAEKSGVIKSDVLPTQKCRAILLRWLPGAQIVQLSGVEHRDVFVCMTFVRVDGLSPTRMVRALGGLVTHKELENDSANKAVFNELLHQSKYRPNDDQFIDLAILYLFMVGHPPDETPRRLEGMAKANDFTGFVARKKHKVIVTIHQRKALLGIPCREWKVEFHLARKEIDLTSATPE